MDEYELRELFDIVQGHQITDEEIYNHPGPHPVLTGNNVLKGYWSGLLVDNDDLLPCITYPTKANAGVAFIQTSPFDANNTAVLIPKAEYRDLISLEWMVCKLPSLLLDSATSKEGVSYVNKDIMEKRIIRLPSPSEQLAEIEDYVELQTFRKRLVDISSQIDNLFSRSFSPDTPDIPEVQFSEIVDYASRNDALSEEGLYNAQRYLLEDMSPNETVSVLSGSSNDSAYGHINIATPKIHMLVNRQCLKVITRGKAGRLAYMPIDNYATNTNAFLFYIKKSEFGRLNIRNEDDEECYLKFLKLYLEPIFINASSNSDVSVFPLTQLYKSLKIPLYSIDDTMKNVVRNYELLEEYRSVINGAVIRLSELEAKELVPNKPADEMAMLQASPTLV